MPYINIVDIVVNWSPDSNAIYITLKYKAIQEIEEQIVISLSLPTN